MLRTDPTGRCVDGLSTALCVGGSIAGSSLALVVATPLAAAAEIYSFTAHPHAAEHRQALARGFDYVVSGGNGYIWTTPPFPLPPPEGQSFRLGPNLDEPCSGGPGGFSLEQLDPNRWLRPGPALDGDHSRWHTGSPMVGEPSTVVLAVTAGGGAQVENVPEGVRNQIQRIADKYGVIITIVGSRAAGTATANSDWDYIIEGKAKARSNAKRELPRGWQGGEIDSFGRESGIDVWNPAQDPVDTNRPYIIFRPR